MRLPVVAWGKGDAPSPGRPGEAAPSDTTKAPPGERKRRTGRHGARVPRRARARAPRRARASAHPARAPRRARARAHRALAHSAHKRTGSARSPLALAHPARAPRRARASAHPARAHRAHAHLALRALVLRAPGAPARRSAQPDACSSTRLASYLVIRFPTLVSDSVVAFPGWALQTLPNHNGYQPLVNRSLCSFKWFT